jgi:hypothetical protein
MSEIPVTYNLNIQESFLSFAEKELNLVKSITSYPICPRNKQYYFDRIDKAIRDKEPYQHILREIFMIVRSYDIKLSDFIAICLVKLDEKNQDYSKNDDRYYSFNYSSDLNGISKVLSMNVLIGVKMGRISAIIDKERVINEDLKDSLIDLNNYVLLVEGIKRGLQ